MEERREGVVHEDSHSGESDRRLRPFGSEVSAVNWPEVGSRVPEEPSESEDVVSDGGVSLGDVGLVVELSGGVELLVFVFVESSVGSSVGSLVGSLVESSVGSSVESSVKSSVGSSVVSVDVELPGGAKPLVSVVLDDGDKSFVSVEFDTAVELVMSVQLKIEVRLERSVPFMLVGS